MNMILHDYATADIKQGKHLGSHSSSRATLSNFDYVVANPLSATNAGVPARCRDDPWQSFQHYGIPPGKQGDYATSFTSALAQSAGKGVHTPHACCFEWCGGLIRATSSSAASSRALSAFRNSFSALAFCCIVVLDKESATAEEHL